MPTLSPETLYLISVVAWLISVVCVICVHGPEPIFGEVSPVVALVGAIAAVIAFLAPLAALFGLGLMPPRFFIGVSLTALILLAAFVIPAVQRMCGVRA